MNFTDKQLAAFQDLYKKEFGSLLSKADAIKKGEKLIRFVKAVNIGLVNPKEYNENVDPDY